MDLRNALFVICQGILIFEVMLNLFYTMNLFVAAVFIPRLNKRYAFTRGITIDQYVDRAISILVPAYNEEKTIVDSVRSFLALDYENYEIIVANDGSKDKTLDTLISSFKFAKVDVEPNDVCESKPIKAIYFSRIEPKLVLVDKENGGKADAQNAAARVARFPYICMVDADTLLDRNSLKDIAIRFAAEPNIVAVGGIIRVANGCVIEDGIVTEVCMPRRFIEKIQVLEYLRSFLFGRVSLAAVKALMIISGAFGVFRWDAFTSIGGLNREAIGEDMDAVIRLYRIIHEKGLNWKIDFVPDAVSWTQVPMTWKSLCKQRERWQRGLMQVMFANRNMFCNPRYGSVGLIGFPYFAIFEMMSALVEFMCYPLAIICLALGIVGAAYILFFISVVFIWGLCISFATILVQEHIKYSYVTNLDFKSLLYTAFFENIGYRQIHSAWRLMGIVKYILNKSSRSSGMKAWASIQRADFME
jgi:cellulose synthase/poly-beta-1,6-N-acetylglucosamine synthase-like glycosyltransferase